VGTDGASAADFEAAEAREGGGADGDIRGEFADDHHAGRVRGDEFGCHGAVDGLMEGPRGVRIQGEMALMELYVVWPIVTSVYEELGSIYVRW